MIEIRSYRRVFDLERRVYNIDSLRLNPAGVPVRGILYFASILLVGLLAAQLPLLGSGVRAIPWLARDLALPGVGASILAVIRLEGRTFHLAALALLGYWLGPRHLAGLQAAPPLGRRWSPEEILILPDGSDPHLRRMRYTGPGAALVAVAHERSDGRMRATVTLRERAECGSPRGSQVILLASGTRMFVQGRVQGRLKR